jgi:ABC-type dipeptide/oligopeptide/nickel transport system permease subunit
VSDVPGVVAILIALLVFPVIAIMGSVTIAALLGWALNRDAIDRNEGSELIDVNY